MKYSRIDEPLYHLDEGNLWEHYRFKSITKSVQLATLIKNEFQWNTNKSKNLLERRGNFENITLFGMSAMWTTYNNLPNTFIKEDHISKTIPNTYEVKFRYSEKATEKFGLSTSYNLTLLST